MTRATPDFYTRVHIAPVPHWSVKERYVIRNDFKEFSTTAEGDKEIYKSSVDEGFLYFCTDMILQSTVAGIFGIGPYDGTTQFDKVRIKVAVDEKIILQLHTPMKITGSATSWIRAWFRFPAGGGTVRISVMGQQEDILFAIGYYNYSCLNEFVYD